MNFRSTRWWPIIVIIAAWMIFASPYLFRGLIPFPSKYLVTFFPPWNAQYAMPVKNAAMPDVISQIYPWKKLTIESWKRGAVPFWNPYSFSGTALAGNYQSAVFSPFNLLFFILPFIDAWSWLILLQPLLAGLGMYAFLSTQVARRSGRLIGSVAFMFCGFMVTWMAYGTLNHAILPLPWALYGLEEFMRKGKFKFLFVVMLATAFSLLAGHFQISLYMIMLSAIYAIFLGRGDNKARKLLLMFMAIVMGIMLSMPQIISSYSAFMNSSRSSGFGEGGEIIPIKYLITIIVPDFFGNPVTRNDWFGHYAEWASYVGVIPLLFAILAIVTIKNKQKNLFTGIFIISILAAVMPVAALFKIPALGTSAASRIIVLSSFALSVLASMGWERLVTAKAKDLYRAWEKVGLFFVLGWGLLLLSLIKPWWLGEEALTVARRNLILPSIELGVGMGLIWLLIYRKKYQTIFITLLLFIMVFDSLRFASKWQPFESREFIYPELPVIKYLQENVGSARVFGNIGGEVANYFHLPVIEGYDALYNKRYGQLISAAGDGRVAGGSRSVVSIDRQGMYTSHLLKFLGVKYVIQRKSDGREIWAYSFWKYPERYKLVYTDDKYEVYEDLEVMPRAYLATNTEAVNSDKQDVVAKILTPGFLDTKQVVIELDDQPYAGPRIGGTGEVQIVKYLPEIVEIEVKAKGEQLLFLSDVYDENWRVSVNGKDSQIYRANYVFRGVVVPDGESRVIFEYKILNKI